MSIKYFFLFMILGLSCKAKPKSKVDALFEQSTAQANKETYVLMIHHKDTQSIDLNKNEIGPLVCIYYSQRPFASTHKPSIETDPDYDIYTRHAPTLKPLTFPIRENMPPPNYKSDAYANIIKFPETNDTQRLMGWTDLKQIQNYISLRLGMKASDVSAKRVTDPPKFNPGITGFVVSHGTSLFNKVINRPSKIKAMNLQQVYLEINGCVAKEMVSGQKGASVGQIQINTSQNKIPTDVDFNEPILDTLREAVMADFTGKYSSEIVKNTPELALIQSTLCPEPGSSKFYIDMNAILREHYPSCPILPEEVKKNLDEENAKQNPFETLKNFLNIKLF